MAILLTYILTPKQPQGNPNVLHKGCLGVALRAAYFYLLCEYLYEILSISKSLSVLVSESKLTPTESGKAIRSILWQKAVQETILNFIVWKTNSICTRTRIVSFYCQIACLIEKWYRICKCIKQTIWIINSFSRLVEMITIIFRLQRLDYL